MRQVSFTLAALTLSALTPFCHATAASDVARLVTPSHRQALAPDQAIALELSADLSADQINDLFLDVDGTDVTPDVNLNGQVVTYQPSKRLAVGDHVVRLFQHVGNENYNEVGRWVVRVGAVDATDSKVWGTAQAQYNFSVRDKNIPFTHTDRHSGSAFLETNAVTGGKDWDTTAHLNGYFDSNNDHEYVQLGEYLFTGRSFGDTTTRTFRFGNHDAGVSNILIDNFNRRGASVVMDYGDHWQVTGFAQDPANRIGNENISGIERAEQRLYGGHVRYAPLGDAEHLALETSVTYGEGASRSESTDAVSDPVKGKGYGAMAGAQWQNASDRINLRGQFAHSDYDFDGDASLVDAVADNAWSARARVAALGDLNAKTYNPTNWNFTLDARRVGTYYYGPANHRLPADQNRVALTSDFYDDSLSVVTDASLMRNNVNDLVDIPTDQSENLGVQVSVTPDYWMNEDNGDGANWWRYSTFTLGGNSTWQYRDRIPVGFVGTDMQQDMQSANAGWSSSLDDDLEMGLNYTYTQFSDDIDATNDSDSHFTELSSTYTPSDRFSITPAFQLEQLNQPGDTRSNIFASLEVNSVLIPEKLTNHTYGSSQLNDSGDDDRQYNAATEFFWRLRESELNSPGYGVAFSINYQDVHGGVATPRSDEGEQFKAYVSLKTDIPYGW